MRNPDDIEAGVVAFLKAKAIELGSPVVVIGKGDKVPQTGPSLLYACRLQNDCDELFFAFFEFMATTAANKTGSVEFAKAAAGFLYQCLPRDQSSRDALKAAVEFATGDTVTVNFYHHQDTDGDPGQAHYYSRLMELKIACQEV